MTTKIWKILYVNSLYIKVKFKNRVENNKAKGEIAHHEQFLPMPQKKTSAAEASESVCIWERFNK